LFCLGSEKKFFLDLLKREGATKLYFTGMLTHGESDFFICYIDPVIHHVHKNFPDFLVQDKSGNWTLLNVFTQASKKILTLENICIIIKI